MTKQKIPKVRFYGFNNYWEMKKMSELVKLINGRAYKQSELLDSGRYRVLRVGNFNTNDKWYYSNLELEENKYAEEGDLLYLWATNFGPEIWKEERVIYHYHIWKIVYDESVVGKEYLYSWLESDKERIQQNTNGSTMVHITKSMMEDRTLNKPMSLSEQSQIGSLFSTIDSLLSSYKDNLENYQSLKKSMLSKMFPKGGQTVPEIRLDGFDGEWEKRKLLEVASYRNGKAHEKDVDENGEFIIVNSKFVSTNGRVKKFSNTQIEPLRKGEIAFVLSDVPNGRALARTFLVDSDCKYSLNQRIAGIAPIGDSDFLHQLINRNKYFLKFDNGVGQTNLSKTEVEEFVSYYPSLPEQQAIGSFFSNLDELISSYQSKIDELETLKKKLLQDMFI